MGASCQQVYMVVTLLARLLHYIIVNNNLILSVRNRKLNSVPLKIPSLGAFVDCRKKGVILHIYTNGEQLSSNKATGSVGSLNECWQSREDLQEGNKCQTEALAECSSRGKKEEDLRESRGTSLSWFISHLSCVVSGSLSLSFSLSSGKKHTLDHTQAKTLAE